MLIIFCKDVLRNNQNDINLTRHVYFPFEKHMYFFWCWSTQYYTNNYQKSVEYLYKVWYIYWYHKNWKGCDCWFADVNRSRGKVTIASDMVDDDIGPTMTRGSMVSPMGSLDPPGSPDPSTPVAVLGVLGLSWSCLLARGVWLTWW